MMAVLKSPLPLGEVRPWSEAEVDGVREIISGPGSPCAHQITSRPTVGRTSEEGVRGSPHHVSECLAENRVPKNPISLLFSGPKPGRSGSKPLSSLQKKW
jgi:hypothetical protein